MNEIPIASYILDCIAINNFQTSSEITDYLRSKHLVKGKKIKGHLAETYVKQVLINLEASKLVEISGYICHKCPPHPFNYSKAVRDYHIPVWSVTGLKVPSEAVLAIIEARHCSNAVRKPALPIIELTEEERYPLCFESKCPYCGRYLKDSFDRFGIEKHILACKKRNKL